jgi:hypothetical protein
MSSDKVLYVNTETKDVIATGNVGIGTTQPLAKLHVNGLFYAPGSVVQMLTKSLNTVTTIASTSFAPTVLTTTITPKFASSTIFVSVNAQVNWGSTVAGNGLYLQIRRDGVEDTVNVATNGNAQAFIYINYANHDTYTKINTTASYIAGNTNATTVALYAARYGANTTYTLIGQPSGHGRSEITVFEIAA